MSFLYPYVLITLLLPLLLAALGIAAHAQARQSWQQLVAPAHRAELVRKPPLWRTVLPATLALLALTFGIIAAARPINGYTESGAVSSGRNLIIALDVSRSMETTDVTPSRLEEARSAAYELINALPSDKIGLIVFSGEADLVVPLTYDHDALKETLYNVNRDWVGTGGTNFGLVLQRAMQDFERSAPDGTNALVILSDGEDTVNTSSDMAKEARSKHLLVITVGIGTPAGGAIPDPHGQNGLWQNAEGKHVISKLNIENLSQFACATGGDFFTMNSGTDLAAFAREAANKLDRHEETFSATKVPNDLYAWFSTPALLLLVGAILLSTEWRKRGRTSVSSVLLLLCAASTPQATAAPAAENAGHYNKGYQLSQEGERDQAREAYSQALLDDDPALQTASHYALGNIAARATFDRLRTLYTGDEETPASQPSPDDLQGVVDELRRNLSAYQDALNINPNFTPARNNKQKIENLIKKLEEEIERLKQQQQNQQQNNQQNQNNQQQQDNKQNQNNQQQDEQQQQNDQQQDDQQKQNDHRQDNDRKNQNNQQQQDDRSQDNQQQQDDSRQDSPQQDNQQQQDEQQQPQDDKKEQEQQQSQAQQSPNDKDKSAKRAAGILKMHLDEEQGSPIPHHTRTAPPAKDY